MNIILNIGLNVSKSYLPKGAAGMQLQYEYVKDFLEKCFGKPICIGLARSETEETVVVQYKKVDSVLYTLFGLSHDLQQDCIAYQIQDDDGVIVGGALVGEGAFKWNYGIFNEKYFIQATV